MNELDWLVFWWDAFDLLSWCEDDACRLNERKLRLLAVACCRTIWPLLTEDIIQRAVKVAEQVADGQAGLEVLSTVRRDAESARRTAEPAGSGAAATREAAITYGSAQLAELLTLEDFTCRHMAQDVADMVLGLAIRAAVPSHWWGTGEGDAIAEKVGSERGPIECDLVREIFFNPLRPPVIASVWRTPQALALARMAYEERRFQDLPLLADALEEAGCTEEAILSHLRGPGPHVRGCWAVDLVLAKE